MNTVWYTPHEPPTHEELTAPVKSTWNPKHLRIYKGPRFVDSMILTLCLASIAYSVQNIHVDPKHNGFCLFVLLLLTTYHLFSMKNH